MAFALETRRLRLREFTITDAPFILRQLNEPSFIENIADRGIRDLQQAAVHLESGPISSYRAHGFGLWAVVEKYSGNLIGMCGLVKRPHLEHPDLGYAFLPEHFGQGFAYEAGTACMAAARNDFALPRLLAIVNPGNVPSRRLLEKLGFNLRRVTMQSADEPALCVYGIDLN
jgi:ribosomal-protein-alanine N-acetyltransferase